MNQTKKTPEMRAKLLELRGMGLSLTKCYQAANIGKKTVQDWRKEDPSLEEDLERVFAEWVARTHKGVVDSAAGGDLNAAKFLLQTLVPEDYSPTQRVEHNIVLEMPGLLKGVTQNAQAWLEGATDEDWKALDERAKAGKLLEADYELLQEPEKEKVDDDD